MSTTIQVSNTTKQVLETLKQKESVSSYDAVIRHLIKVHTKIEKSLFGSQKGLRWRKEDRFDFNEL